MEKKRLLIIIAAVFFVGAAGFLYSLGAVKDSGKDTIIFNDAAKGEERITEDVSALRQDKEPAGNLKDIKEEQLQSLYVYICGEVKEPDVYEMKPGLRIADAVKRAGGFTIDARQEAVNLAEKLEDGQQITIPSKKEPLPETADNKKNVSSGSKESQGKINLNTATKEELMTLPGIGAAKADKILEYRESNGPFDSIDGLKNISGIKDGVIDKFRSFIRIN